MFGRAIAIVSLLTISLLPANVQAADTGCLPVDLDSFDEVQWTGRLDGYAGWDTAIGFTKSRLPMVPTMIALRGDVACDLTNGLDAFVGARASPLVAEDALALATLAVGAIYVDVLPDPVVLPGMGFAASAPTLTRIDEGYVADFTVWTARNGVIVDVHVVMDGAIDASFVVKERAVGDFKGVVEGWNLLPGMTDKTVAGDVSGMVTKTMMGTNADGKKWRITYFTQNYGNNDALADYHAAMHMSGALSAYANETSWGLVSPDPDGTLDLTLDGCDCIFSGNNANIHMFPRANDILPLLPGLNYREESETAELIVGHELFHHFQYGVQQWRHGGWVTEGMARFSETVNVPDFTFLPTTLTYWPNLNGMNGFILAAQGSITSHSYDWSIVWGYLYANEGGMPLIVRALQESATGGTNGNIDGPAFIQRAMDAVPGGTHATFAEAYADFAKGLVTHEGFVWGAPDGSQVHDWSTYFVALPRDNIAATYSLLQPWGIKAHNADPTNAAGAAVISYVPNANIAASIYSVTAGTPSLTAAQPVNALVGVDDAALLLVRPNPPLAQDTAGAAGAYAVAIVK